jgi:hypothetical protein
MRLTAITSAIGARAQRFWFTTEHRSLSETRMIHPSGAPYPVLDYDAAPVPEARIEHQRLRCILQGHFAAARHDAPAGFVLPS